MSATATKQFSLTTVRVRQARGDTFTYLRDVNAIGDDVDRDAVVEVLGHGIVMAAAVLKPSATVVWKRDGFDVSDTHIKRTVESSVQVMKAALELAKDLPAGAPLSWVFVADERRDRSRV